MHFQFREENIIKNILVTDAQFKASLAVIRSLGKRNMKITAGSEIKSAMGLFSKYTTEKLFYPNPRTSPNAFLKYLLDIVEKNNYDCIIPTHTYTVFLLSKYRDIFSDYVELPPPDSKVFYNAYDKKKLIQIAMENGIACPKTYFSDILDEIVSTVRQYPVVVKPSGRHGVGIAICDTASDLKENYTDMTEKYGPCIVQEFIPNGGELGVYTLFDFNSEPIALTVQKRIRTLYYYGGVSTLRETVKNEDFIQIAFNLLKKIRWSGAAMVEFRIDARDGIPKLMEINPRFWGSLQLSILSGVDFPYLLYQLMMQDDPPRNLNYKEGVQCRWLLGDIAGFFQRSNKLDVFMDFFRPNVHYDIISLSDPTPGIISFFSPLHNSSDEEPREDNLNTVLNEMIKR